MIGTYKDLGDEVEVSHLADDVRERLNWNKTGIVFMLPETALIGISKKLCRHSQEL